MKITLKIEMDHNEVEKLIGQNPMGSLDEIIFLTINGQNFEAICEGYVSDGVSAKVTLSTVDDY